MRSCRALRKLARQVLERLLASSQEAHANAPPGELHRVIARCDYTAIEVSTPELDDVIRWQDDTGRGHGRIESEHTGTGR